MIIFKQAAAIPFRIEKNRFEILLITSRNQKRWIIPKGLIENGDSASETAKRETLEEAGVDGEINGKSIGVYEYEKWGGLCKVEVFPMQVKTVHDKWDEKVIRKRQWYLAKDALKKAEPEALKKIIRKFIKQMKAE